MHFHYYSGSPTKKVPKRKATTEQDLDEMKAKIEDERKKLKDVKNMAEEEKNKIKFELKRQEDELAKVWILCFKFSLTRETDKTNCQEPKNEQFAKCLYLCPWQCIIFNVQF